MRAGKKVATEVGGAYTLEDCYELVRAYKETGIHCMMLENCCYGREELMVLNMVRNGLFGQIVHADGGYMHDLREEISFGEKNRHYRLRNYKSRNCENYPTHELGPIAKVLGINRGNRMVSLTSVASCSKGLNEYAKKNPEAPEELKDFPFSQGDVVTTTIKCENGQTVVLTLDTTLPRFYNRNFTIRGTKGMFHEMTRSVFIDGVHNSCEFDWKPQWNNIEEYREEWDHKIWKDFLNDGVRGGHGGMDWLVTSAFFESVEKDSLPPIDTYDTAAWMCITPLSEISVANGGKPVEIPDFTDGAWKDRKDVCDSEYSLDK